MKTKQFSALLALCVTVLAVLIPQKSWALPAATNCARFNDWEDKGCQMLPGRPGGPPSDANNPGGPNASCELCSHGMPRWWVDEPYINLHVVDEPLSYKTSSGQDMIFRWLYKQNFTLPSTNQVPDFYFGYVGGQRAPDSPYIYRMRCFGVTNGAWASTTNAAWGHNWMENIVFWDQMRDDTVEADGIYESPIFSQDYEALLFTPEGAVEYFGYNVTNTGLPAGLAETVSTVQLQGLTQGLQVNYPTVGTPTATNGIYWGTTSNGFELLYPDGSKEIFGLAFWDPLQLTSKGSTAHALLTQRVDPQGRVTQLGYESISFTNACKNADFYGAFRLRYVVDPDRQTNTFYYNTGMNRCHILTFNI